MAGPAKLDALLGLATIAEAESSKAEAATWYRQVLTVDPTNISAISGLSRLGVAPGKISPTPKAAGSSSTQGPS